MFNFLLSTHVLTLSFEKVRSLILTTITSLHFTHDNNMLKEASWVLPRLVLLPTFWTRGLHAPDLSAKPSRPDPDFSGYSDLLRRRSDHRPTLRRLLSFPHPLANADYHGKRWIEERPKRRIPTRPPSPITNTSDLNLNTGPVWFLSSPRTSLWFWIIKAPSGFRRIKP